LPKPPDPKGKSNRLVLAASPEQEIYVRAFKEIVARNGLTIRDILFEKAVLPFLKEHNWPPGNSQTVLPKFGLTDKKRCFRCKGEFESLIRVLYKSGRILGTCRNCLEGEEKKGTYSTVKRVLGVI